MSGQRRPNQNFLALATSNPVMPYRDDQASLEARRDELRRDLDEATERAASLAGATREKENLTRELAAVEARLARAASRRLPLLQNVRVASPCSASWDDMDGDDRVRFCGSCEKNVYNLSAMPGEEAERLLAEHEGSICVRLYRRADGTVLTSDCPVGVRRKRVRHTLIAAGAAGALAAAATAAFSTMGEPTHGEVTTGMGAPVLMGKVAAPLPSDPPQVDSVPTMGSAVVLPAPPTPAMGGTGHPAPPSPPRGRHEMGR